MKADARKDKPSNDKENNNGQIEKPKKESEEKFVMSFSDSSDEEEIKGKGKKPTKKDGKVKDPYEFSEDESESSQVGKKKEPVASKNSARKVKPTPKVTNPTKKLIQSLDSSQKKKVSLKKTRSPLSSTVNPGPPQKRSMNLFEKVVERNFGAKEGNKTTPKNRTVDDKNKNSQKKKNKVAGFRN